MADSTQHEATAELNEALAAAFAANNFEGLGPFYTEDATLMPPRGDALEGRAAAGGFWSTVANRFGSAAFTTAALKDLGDGVRRESGTYTMGRADGTTVGGKYLFVWRLVEGEWQIESGIWNRNGEAGAGGQRAGGGQGQGQRQRQGGGGGYRQGGAAGGRGGAGYRGGGAGRGAGYRGGGAGGAGGGYRAGGGRPSFQTGGSGLGGGGGGGGGGGRRGGGGGSGGRGQGGGPQRGGQDGGGLYEGGGGLYSGPKD